jgi:hypothetical protein
VGLPDYHGLGEGLLLLSLFHVIGQLDLGLRFWHLQGVADDGEDVAVGKGEPARAHRLGDLIRLTAYRLCVEADGWRRLCADLNVDPEALLCDLPCQDALRLTEQAARTVRWSPEEAAAYLRRLGPADAEPPTSEGAAQAMRQFIDRRVAWWDG